MVPAVSDAPRTTTWNIRGQTIPVGTAQTANRPPDWYPASPITSGPPGGIPSTSVQRTAWRHGHLGYERVLALVRERFYWSYIRKDIERFLNHVCCCLKHKRPTLPTREPLQPIITTSPFQLIAIDYVHLERSSGGYEYILVVVNHFTRYAQAYPTKNKTGTTAADKIFNDFIPRFGFPEKIHHNINKEFENSLFKRLEKSSGVNHSRTTPYHPQGNGKVERMNKTLLGILRALPETHKTHWKDHVSKLVHAYNCTRHEATCYSPFSLLLSHSPRLPIDLAFNLTNKDDTTDYPQYVPNGKQQCKKLVPKPQT